MSKIIAFFVICFILYYILKISRAIKWAVIFSFVYWLVPYNLVMLIAEALKNEFLISHLPKIMGIIYFFTVIAVYRYVYHIDD